MQAALVLSAFAALFAFNAVFVDARGVQMIDLFDGEAPAETPETGHHHHHNHHHKSHRTAVTGLKKDETGEEYMLCMSRDRADDEDSVATCKVSQEASMGVKGLGLACMTVFDSDHAPLKQGCWIHQQDEVIEDACRIGACVADPDGDGPYFCCCRGNLCNKEYTVGGTVFTDKKKKSIF